MDPDIHQSVVVVGVHSRCRGPQLLDTGRLMLEDDDLVLVLGLCDTGHLDIGRCDAGRLDLDHCQRWVLPSKQTKQLFEHIGPHITPCVLRRQCAYVMPAGQPVVGPAQAQSQTS